jgi:hypothetical protein
VTFHLEWPKYDGSNPPWTWDPPPLTIIADAYVSLVQDGDDHYLHIQPIQFRFLPVQMAELGRTWRKYLKGQDRIQQPHLPSDDQKFFDLLVIALNIVGAEYAPRISQNIKIPVPTISGQPIIPALLDVSNDCITVGAGLDRTALTDQNTKAVLDAFATYQALLDEDLREAGGISNVVLQDGHTRPKTTADLKFASPNQIARRLHRSSAYLRGLESRARVKTKPTQRRAATVPDGLAIGVNQYCLTKLANSALPAPVDHEDGPVDILPGLLQGYARYWVHLSNAQVTISGATVSGSLSVDAGGALGACVKKFWDCSWKWTCGELRLQITGNPGLQLSLKAADDIAFQAQITGTVNVGTNLPDPFDKVVAFFADGIIKGIIAIINLAIANVQFEIVPPAITIPNQKTRLILSGFTPFGFVRAVPAGLSVDRKTFIAYSVGVSADTGGPGVPRSVLVQQRRLGGLSVPRRRVRALPRHKH